MVLRGDAHESLLDTYDAERHAFAPRFVRTTYRIFTIATNQAPSPAACGVPSSRG